MKDLAARLRAIVKNDLGGRPRESIPGVDPRGRELTYEIDAPGADAPAVAVAEALGGQVQGKSCVVIDRLFESDRSHGRWRVDDCRLDEAMPLGLLDPRCVDIAGWTSRVVFFDIETTGLSGGAGTLAFLAGCGWFEPGGFRVRQFLLTGAAGEPSLLDALGEILGGASLLVTYNGRTFDVPFMEMRWAFHRREIRSKTCRTSTCCPPLDDCGAVATSAAIRVPRTMASVGAAVCRRSSAPCWDSIASAMCRAWRFRRDTFNSCGRVSPR